MKGLSENLLPLRDLRTWKCTRHVLPCRCMDTETLNDMPELMQQICGTAKGLPTSFRHIWRRGRRILRSSQDFLCAEKSSHLSAVETERVSRTPYCCSHDLFKGFGMLRLSSLFLNISLTEAHPCWLLLTELPALSVSLGFVLPSFNKQDIVARQKLLGWQLHVCYFTMKDVHKFLKRHLILLSFCFWELNTRGQILPWWNITKVHE